MTRFIFSIIFLVNFCFLQSQEYDYPKIGKGGNCGHSEVACTDAREISSTGFVTMHLESIKEGELILKTSHQELNFEGHRLLLGDQMGNLEKGIEYKLNLSEDYVFSEEEINAFRFSENLIIPKGEYTVYFDDENIYLKYKLR